MDSKMKMIAGIALVLGVLSMVFLAAPIQAYVNGTGDGDLLRTYKLTLTELEMAIYFEHKIKIG